MSKGRKCKSGKVPYRSRQLAALGARRLAQKLHAEGRIVETIYAYECGCGAWHITRMQRYYDRENRPAHYAVSRELQVQLMTPTARERLEAREEEQRRAAAEEALKRLPDPMPTPSKIGRYSNRPRGLRYR